MEAEGEVSMRRSGSVAVVVLAMFLLAALRATPVVAAPGDYALENVADSGGALAAFGQPTIDATGNVVFAARDKTTLVDGIYAGGAGEEPTPLVDASGSLQTFFRPVISANGFVAFRATSDNNTLQGIYTVPLAGGVVTTVALDDGTQIGEIASLNGDPWISATGTIAFGANVASMPNAHSALGVGFAPGGAPIDFALEGTSTNGQLDGTDQMNRVGAPVGITANGDVLFNGTLGTGASSYYTINATGGGLTARPGIVPAGAEALVMGPTGWVAYTNASAGISLRDPGGSTAVVANFQPLGGTCSVPAVNATGDVAFSANFFQGGVFDYGLYTGGDAIGDRVAGKGTPFLGSTILTVTASPTGLNDAGQIAFRYLLADNRTGIAVATLPEAGAFSGFAALAALLSLRRSRLMSPRPLPRHLASPESRT